MERKGAAYRIKKGGAAWTDRPANTTWANEQGSIESQAHGGSYVMMSVRARNSQRYRAAVESGSDVYATDPMRTKRRSQIAAESLANRVGRGGGREYRQR
jgi:hypothetical protein